MKTMKIPSKIMKTQLKLVKKRGIEKFDHRSGLYMSKNQNETIEYERQECILIQENEIIFFRRKEWQEK